MIVITPERSQPQAFDHWIPEGAKEATGFASNLLAQGERFKISSVSRPSASSGTEFHGKQSQSLCSELRGTSSGTTSMSS